MKRFLALAAFATVVTFSLVPAAVRAHEEASVATSAPAAPAIDVKAGRPLYSANGGKIGAIYKVTESGQAQVILDGKLISLPVASLTEVDGRIVTPLTRRELKTR